MILYFTIFLLFLIEDERRSSLRDLTKPQLVSSRHIKLEGRRVALVIGEIIPTEWITLLLIPTLLVRTV
jgi:hypothetical protein